MVAALEVKITARVRFYIQPTLRQQIKLSCRIPQLLSENVECQWLRVKQKLAGFV